MLHLRTPAPSPHAESYEEDYDYGRPVRSGAYYSAPRSAQRARSPSPEAPSYEAPPAWRDPSGHDAGRPRSPPPAALGDAWGTRGRAERKHFHGGYEAPADGAGLLYGEALGGRPHAQRNHAVPPPPPPPRPPSPRRGVKQTAHVKGGTVVRGEAADDAAEAAGRAHWRAGGRPTWRRGPAEQARPATANPLDMTLREEQEGRARTPRRGRGAGAPTADLLDAHATPTVHQVWPPGRPSASWQPAAANRLQPAHASLAARGQEGARGRSDVVADLLVSHGVRSDRAPRVSRTAVMPRSRGDEYILNRQRCNGTSAELTAPPLYDVRPGTAPSWS